jgi:hypothetical protein
MPFLNTVRSLFYVLLSIMVGTTATAESNDSGGPLAEGLIKIENHRLVYKGKSVAVPYTRERLIKVFGKPSREIYNTAGTVVIWDDLGLTCYGCQEPPKVPEEFQFMTNEEKKAIKYQPYVDSITLFVRKYNPYPQQENKYSHEPRWPFQGKLELDGVELDGTVTFYQFVENRKSNPTILLPENSFSFFIRCKPAPHEVTLHTIRDKYDVDFMSVYSVSIRNIGHYYNNARCTEQFSFEPEASNHEARQAEQPGQTGDKQVPQPEEKQPELKSDAVVPVTQEFLESLPANK